MNKTDMKPTHVNLREDQRVALAALAERLTKNLKRNVTPAELVRRAIDELLERNKGK